ncbi:MAG: hypothetical protein KIS94_10750 [Chitinophagales bacterium]|nr:hypothetical protein [Chitinophagales bacterium]
MRAFAALAFVLLLLLSLFGSYFAFMAERYAIKKEVKQLLKAEKIKNAREFVFTAGEYRQLKKYEGGKEFSLNGDMYDVVSKKERDGKIILVAYYDHKETSLLDKFVKLFDDGPQKEKSSNRYQTHIFLPEFTATGLWMVTPPSLSVVELMDVAKHAIISNYGETPTPPPDSLLLS